MFRFTIGDENVDRHYHASNIAYLLRGNPVRVLVSEDSPRRAGRHIDGIIRGVDRDRTEWLGLRTLDRATWRATGNTFYVLPEAIHLITRN